MKEKSTLIHIDPGPGAFVNFFTTPYEPWKDLNAVVLSHLHLDHSADVNTILESATESGKRRGLKLLAPSDALKGEKRVVLSYIQNLVKVEILKQGELYEIGDITLKVLHSHKHHKVEVYSLEFRNGEGKNFVYIPCGKFEEYWLDYLPESADLMVFNTTFYRRRATIDHLNVEDVVKILQIKKPKRAIITHYSVEMLLKNPLKVAKEIEEKTGVKTLAAEDGSIFEI